MLSEKAIYILMVSEKEEFVICIKVFLAWQRGLQPAATMKTCGAARAFPTVIDTIVGLILQVTNNFMRVK